jgi:hypothetical protein
VDVEIDFGVTGPPTTQPLPSTGGSQPQITSITIPDQISNSATWTATFTDPGGDINLAKLFYWTGRQWQLVNAGWNPGVEGQTSGQIQGQVTCPSVGKIYYAVVLYDAAGQKAVKQFIANCVRSQSGTPPPVPPQEGGSPPQITGISGPNPVQGDGWWVITYQGDVTQATLLYGNQVKARWTPKVPGQVSIRFHCTTEWTHDYTIVLEDAAGHTVSKEFTVTCVPVSGASSDQAQTPQGLVSTLLKWLGLSGTMSQSTPPALLALRDVRVNYKAGQLDIRITGTGIGCSEVRLYMLSGQLIAEEQGMGDRLRLRAMDTNGLPLANGVYLYIVTVRGMGGQILTSELRKLVVLR